MKKTLSVILALVMLMSCCVVAFAADGCDCDDCTKSAGCHCCIYCPYLNEDYILQCAQVEVVDGEKQVVLCCAHCTGTWPCSCGLNSNCGCATCNGSSLDANDGKGEPLVPEDMQDDFVSGFQKIIKIVADAFNKFFDAIFEFLRINEVL